MSPIESHTVPQNVNAQRLSDYAVGIFSSISSRKGIKKAIRKGWITINSRIGLSGDYIVGGELLKLIIEEPKNPILQLQLDVLFEDEHLAVINKPAGIAVSGNKSQTIENALPFNLVPSSAKDALEYPQAAHRLDHPTSGVLLIGKTRSAVISLNRMFESKLINKKYHAICLGNLTSSGDILSPIDAKDSQSTYKVIARQSSKKYGQLNFVELIPQTGRRHQLRKHLASINCPILGDKAYGIEGKVLTGKGLYLHASSLSFYHPLEKDSPCVTIDSDLPKKFENIFPNLIKSE